MQRIGGLFLFTSFSYRYFDRLKESQLLHNSKYNHLKPSAKDGKYNIRIFAAFS